MENSDMKYLSIVDAFEKYANDNGLHLWIRATNRLGFVGFAFYDSLSEMPFVFEIDIYGIEDLEKTIEDYLETVEVYFRYV